MQKVWSGRGKVWLARRLVTGGFALAWWATAAPARADDAAAANAEPAPAPEETAAQERSGPHTANSIQLGLGFRYGVKLSDGDINPWGSGLGVDLGYTFPNAIYVGGNFEYFFGETLEAEGVKLSANILQFGVEGGYDVGIGQNFVIRPKLGVGMAHLKSSFEGCGIGALCEAGPHDSSDTKAAIAPGATFLLFTKHVSVALDVRYDVVFTDPSLQGLIFSVGIGF
jgi:hypothetical protein